MFWGIILIILALMLLGIGIWNASELFTNPNDWSTANTWKEALWTTLLIAAGASLFGVASRNLVNSPALGG